MQLMPRGNMQYLGIDIGGTFIKYAIINGDSNIVNTWKKPSLHFNTAEEFYDYLCNGIDVSNIKLVGISAPGIIDKSSNVLSKAAKSIEIMYETNVNHEISKRLNVPADTINDAKAAAYCEIKIGNGQNTKSSAYWIIGTGIGGCICCNDKIIYGEDNIAGEFSHLPISISNGQTHGLGSIASINALIDIYNSNTTSDKKVRYGEEVCSRYLANEDIAVSVINEWCLNNVMGLYMVTAIFNPEVICIGGGISEEKWFIKKLCDTYYNTKFRLENLVTTKITKCRYNNLSNVIGSVLYARNNLE